jgi:hypothetical protein
MNIHSRSISSYLPVFYIAIFLLANENTDSTSQRTTFYLGQECDLGKRLMTRCSHTNFTVCIPWELTKF